MYLHTLEEQIFHSLCNLIPEKCKLKPQSNKIMSLLEEILYHRRPNTDTNHNPCNAIDNLRELENCACGHLHTIKFMLGFISKNNLNLFLSKNSVTKQLQEFILYARSRNNYIKTLNSQKWQKQLKELLQKTQNPSLLMYYNASLAIEKFQQKKYESAKLYWNKISEGLNKYKKDIPADIRSILVNRAWTYHHLKLYKQANNYFKNCISWSENPPPKIIIAMADNFYHLGKYDSAIELCEQIKRPKHFSYTKHNVLKMECYTQALLIISLSIYEQARRAKKISQRKNLTRIAFNILNKTPVLGHHTESSKKPKKKKKIITPEESNDLKEILFKYYDNIYFFCEHESHDVNQNTTILNHAVICCDLKNYVLALRSLETIKKIEKVENIRKIKNIKGLFPDICWIYARIYYHFYLKKKKSNEKEAREIYASTKVFFDDAKQSNKPPLYIGYEFLSEVCMLFGDTENADKYISLALKKHHTAYSLLQKIKVLIDLNNNQREFDEKKYGEALKLSDELVKMDNENEEILFIRAHILAVFGRLQETIKCFDKIIKTSSRNTNHYKLIKAKYLFKLQRYQEAAVDFESLKRKYPKNFEIPTFLALIRFEKKEYKKSLGYCKKALEINCNALIPKMIQVSILYIQGEYKKLDDIKINTSEQTTEDISHQLMLHCNFSHVGILFLRKKWTDLNPVLSRLENFLVATGGDIVCKLHDGLWKIMPILKGMQPIHAFYYFNTMVCLEQGKYKDAFTSIKSFYMHSYNLKITELLSYYLPGKLKESEKINMLNNLTEISRYDISLLYAELYFRLSEFNNALDCYFTALHLNPSSIQINYKIAMCFKKMREYSLAAHFLVKLYKIINEQSPEILKELKECEKLSQTPALETSILHKKREIIKNNMTEFFEGFLPEIKATWLTPLKHVFVISYNLQKLLPEQASALLLKIQNWINDNEILGEILSTEYTKGSFSCTLKDPYSLYTFILYRLKEELKKIQKKANDFILEERGKMNKKLIKPCLKILTALNSYGCSIEFSHKDIRFFSNEWKIKTDSFNEIIKRNASASKIKFGDREYILDPASAYKFWSYARKRLCEDTLRIACVNKNKAVDPILFLDDLYKNLEKKAESLPKKNTSVNSCNELGLNHSKKIKELCEKIKGYFKKNFTTIPFDIETVDSESAFIFIARGNITKFKRQVQKFIKKLEEYLLITKQYCNYITEDYHTAKKKRSKKKSKQANGVILHFNNSWLYVLGVMQRFCDHLEVKKQNLLQKKKPPSKQSSNKKSKKKKSKKNLPQTTLFKRSTKPPKQQKTPVKKFPNIKNVKTRKTQKLSLKKKPIEKQQKTPIKKFPHQTHKKFYSPYVFYVVKRNNPNTTNLPNQLPSKKSPIQPPNQLSEQPKQTWTPFSSRQIMW